MSATVQLKVLLSEMERSLQFLQRKLAAARACVRGDLASFQAKVRAAAEAR